MSFTGNNEGSDSGSATSAFTPREADFSAGIATAGLVFTMTMIGSDRRDIRPATARRKSDARRQDDRTNLRKKSVTSDAGAVCPGRVRGVSGKLSTFFWRARRAFRLPCVRCVRGCVRSAAPGFPWLRADDGERRETKNPQVS